MISQDMKYVLVIGGVISGVGKGIVASSIGTILKANGVRVTSIKIDPYINIDAGTFSPYEHGAHAVFFFIYKVVSVVNIAVLVLLPIVLVILFEYRRKYRRYFFTYFLAICDSRYQYFYHQVH